MTETEAIKTINDAYETFMALCTTPDLDMAMAVAIKALEEIQQYQEWEERLEKVYGDCPGLLEIVVKQFENHAGIDLPEPIFKARLLTDGEVDKWEAYKRLGTVEELEKIKESIKSRREFYQMGYRDGFNTGTKGFKPDKNCILSKMTIDDPDEKTKENTNDFFNFDSPVVNTDYKEWQQYRALGTVEELQKAMEKQRAKKLKGKVSIVFDSGVWDVPCTSYYCPDCGVLIERKGAKYCFNCGQAIDRSEEEDD